MINIRFTVEKKFFFLFFRKMKTVILCLCALAVVASCAAQQFVNKYDNFNTDSIIQNERILLAYYKCVMEKGPCTKDGKNFKRKCHHILRSNKVTCFHGNLIILIFPVSYVRYLLDVGSNSAQCIYIFFF